MTGTTLADIERTIAEYERGLAEKGEYKAARVYAVLGRCYQALGRPEATQYFQMALTKALHRAATKADLSSYVDAAVFARFLGDDAAAGQYLEHVYTTLRTTAGLFDIQTLVEVCFLSNRFAEILPAFARALTLHDDYSDPETRIYQEHAFAQAYLADDRAGMARVVAIFADWVILFETSVTDTAGLSILEIAEHARVVLAAWDAAHAR